MEEYSSLLDYCQNHLIGAWKSMRSSHHLPSVIRRRRALAIFVNMASSWRSICCRAQQAIGNGEYVEFVDQPDYLMDAENPCTDQLAELDAIMMEHMATMREIFTQARDRLWDDGGL